jgi:hypothetical protein
MVGKDKETSIWAINIPLVNAVLVGAWLIGTTVTLTVQWVTVKSSLDVLNTSIIAVGDKVNARISFLEKDFMSKNLTRWTRDNQELWCVRTEQANPNWKCGELPSLVPDYPPKAGSLEWWGDERAPRPYQPKQE